MAKIKVKDLQQGMHLSSDVCDLNGRFLIGTGCELTQKHIKALNAWGVISVDVNADEIEVEQQQSSSSNEEIEEKVKILNSEFVLNDIEHPFISELISEAVKFRLTQKTDTK